MILSHGYPTIQTKLSYYYVCPQQGAVLADKYNSPAMYCRVAKTVPFCILNMISKEKLDEYKALYKEHFNEDLSDQEALEQAINLVNLMKTIYRPIPKKK